MATKLHVPNDCVGVVLTPDGSTTEMVIPSTDPDAPASDAAKIVLGLALAKGSALHPPNPACAAAVRALLAAVDAQSSPKPSA